ncbi:hypothetical protein ACXPVS_19390 [Pseudomonas sp. Ma2-10]
MFRSANTAHVALSSSESTAGNGPSGLAFVSSINALTIDLPGAEPGSVYLELSMVGDPEDTQGYRHLIKNSRTSNFKPPRPWRDMTPHWLSSSVCQWIPFKEGQGLRLSGPFIGGERGLAFTLNDSTGVIELQADPMPQLDRVPSYPLGEELPGAIYLQPKDKT